MTVDELLARESIRHVIASYTLAGDRLREDEFAAVFTEDAILESDGVGEADAFRYVGKDEIRQWIGRWKYRPEGAPHQASFVRHHLGTCMIDLTGHDTASGRTYWVAYTDIGPDHAGHYVDSFRKHGESWRIAHRRVRLDWRSPRSLFAAAISSSR